MITSPLPSPPDSVVARSGLGAPASSSKKRTKKRTPLRIHVRRLATLAIGLVLNRWVRLGLGQLNRRFGWIASVFVMYPATSRYASTIVYPGTVERRKWQPFPAMLIRQGNRWCLVFAISAYEKEVLRGGNENLTRLLERAKRIQRELHAEHLSFSGILPGLMAKHDVPHEGREADTTVRVVASAIEEVTAQVGYEPNTPVILIGAAGYIGQRLQHTLEAKDAASGGRRRVYGVDPSLGLTSLPNSLRGERALLVNVASRRALAGYLADVWKGLVLLNEVYPEPSQREVDSLAASGVPAYHVVGVQATAYPSFPGAYRGGAPCCAAIPSDEMAALVREL